MYPYFYCNFPPPPSHIQNVSFFPSPSSQAIIIHIRCAFTLLLLFSCNLRFRRPASGNFSRKKRLRLDQTASGFPIMALRLEHEKSHATPVFLSFTIAKDYEVFDFSFPKPTAAPAPAGFRESAICRKRARPLADIDGECREITKKRRLRLTFVTSRLSAPFASPPRNNVDRGNSKIAIWAKQRAIPPHQFRKMAILNRIKREAMALREAQQRQIEIARQQHLFVAFPLVSMNFATDIKQ